MARDYLAYSKHIGEQARGLRQQIPEVISGFRQVQKAVMTEGALSVKHKQLIALGLAIGARCEGCIAAHVDGALEAGASAEEVCETIGVAIEMGGGPSFTYGALAYDALQQFLAAREAE